LSGEIHHRTNHPTFFRRGTLMDNSLINTILNLALITMVVMLPFAGWRVYKGTGSADRLLGVDMMTSLLIGIIILLAPLEQTESVIDMGIALAALGFAGTLSIARYISEGRVF
jgi:multisubunit Na+/H+ antiporter MnhF subunit